MKIYTQLLDPKEESREQLIHDLEHKEAVDKVLLNVDDLSRRRFTCETTFGEIVGISLPRSLKLFDGAVLEISERYCLMVKVEPENWLRLEVHSSDVALRLGYFAGNLHWAVKFDENRLSVAISGDVNLYLDRINNVFTDREVKILGLNKTEVRETK